jgi:hypothetical protein
MKITLRGGAVTVIVGGEAYQETLAQANVDFGLDFGIPAGFVGGVYDDTDKSRPPKNYLFDGKGETKDKAWGSDLLTAIGLGFAGAQAARIKRITDAKTPEAEHEEMIDQLLVPSSVAELIVEIAGQLDPALTPKLQAFAKSITDIPKPDPIVKPIP